MGGVRIIGDVHGKRQKYLKVAKESPSGRSIQVGDLDFNYHWLYELDAEKHKVIAGNHDNYSTDDDGKFYLQTPHFLGDFGVYDVPGYREIFFVRGEFSIDWKGRMLGVDLFPNEELNYMQSYAALEEYEKVKPSLVISHGCPISVIDKHWPNGKWDGELIKPSHTARLLELMLKVHQPVAWIFGHHHKHLNVLMGRTNFICLPELGFIDLENK